jgi:hypothetical protein
MSRAQAVACPPGVPGREARTGAHFPPRGRAAPPPPPPSPPLALWAAVLREAPAPQVLAPTEWRRCAPRARGRRGPEGGGGEAGGGRGGSAARAALACSRAARVTGRLARWAPAPGDTDGRARAAAGVRGRGGGRRGRGGRAVRCRRAGRGGEGVGGPGRTSARSLLEEPLPRLLFPSRTESGSVSPPRAHSPRASPRGGCSSAPPAPAPLRGRRAGGGGGGTRGAALCAARRGAAAQPPDRGPGARCTFRPHEDEVKAAAGLPPSAGGGRGRKGTAEGVRGS